MHLRALWICAIFCWVPPAQAQSCAEIYGALKQEAMYCGFFCDQGKIEPLQEIYEKNCIFRVVSPSLFDLDYLLYESTWSSRHEDMTAQPAK